MSILPRVSEATINELSVLLDEKSYTENIKTWASNFRAENPELYKFVVASIERELFSKDSFTLSVIMYACLAAQIASDNATIK